MPNHRRVFTEEEKNIIREMAARKESRRQMQLAINCPNTTLDRLLSELGIEIVDSRHKDGSNVYGLNKHYFDEIDTPNKAYIVGFLFADGTNMSNGKSVRISLQINDEYILNRMKEEMGTTVPLMYNSVVNPLICGTQCYGEFKEVMLRIDSTRINKRLREIGMIPNKTNVIEFPKDIPDELMCHFVRGYFDGNGHVTYSVGKSTTKRIGITSGSLVFCNQFKEYLSKLGIKANVTPKSRGKAYTCEITNGGGMIKFFHHLYDDSDMKLIRKYDRYKMVLDTINVDLIKYPA